MKTLSLNRCPIHTNFYAIMIEDEHGGVRVTSSKCCGQWRQVRVFRMSAHNWHELAEQAMIAAEEAEKAEATK